MAGVQVAKWKGGDAVRATHDCDILFDFVMAGKMTLSVDGEPDFQLSAGDAFVVPPDRVAQFHGLQR